MGTASFSFDPPAVPLARPAAAIGVVRFAEISQQNPNSRFAVLPNVVCEEVQAREGADPGSARFRYILNDADPSLPYPDGFEDLYPLGSSGRYVVRNDDRLLVYAFGSGGDVALVSDGFAQVPEVSLSPEGQSVTFQAIGVAVRLWDKPLSGSVQQNGDHAHEVSASPTDRPARFNPNVNGIPVGNMAADDDARIDGSEGQDGTGYYRAFIDPALAANDSAAVKSWTLPEAIRYLLWVGNPDEEFVKNGDTSGLDQLLKSLKPKTGTEYDPRDPSTYTASDIVIRDFDASNRPAIESIAALCDQNGFRVQFSLFMNGDMTPVTRINFTRRDGAFGQKPKTLGLQPQGDPLDPGLSNVGGMTLARDLAGIFNQVRIETDPVRYEVSFVLACGFEPADVDATTANRKAFLRANWDATTTQESRNKYRRYVLDELGEGYWDFKSGSTVVPIDPVVDFSTIFLGPDGKLGGTGDKKVYADRYRTGEMTLLSIGADKKPLRAQLAVSRDYAGKYPGIWDGTGTWQPITGGWDLLKDAMGIYVNIEDPEQWDIGEWKPPGGKTRQNSGKTLRGITSQSSPTTLTTYKYNYGNFWLRLTTVVEGDFGLAAVASKRPASPTKYAVERRLDCRDHYRKELVDTSSPFFDGTGADTDENGFQVIRDDTDKATAYAEAVRSANEFGPTAGSVTVPRFVNNYSIGDRIAGINGRNVSLQINATTGVTEAPQYPSVASIRWQFGASQTTTLMLSDRRAEPRQS